MKRLTAVILMFFVLAALLSAQEKTTKAVQDQSVKPIPAARVAESTRSSKENAESEAYLKLSVNELNSELAAIEAQQAQYRDILNALEGQKMLIKRWLADSTKLVENQTKKASKEK